MEIKAIQASLNGVWRDAVGGCPHYHGQRDSVGVCDARKMSPCIYETAEATQGCEIFREILEEWKIEAGIYGITDPDEEALSVGVMPGNLERSKDD